VVARWIGRSFIAVGALILLFVVYELYGTGLMTHRYQVHAKHEFQAAVKQAETSGPGATMTAVGPPATLRDGGVALMDIPKIHLDIVVVEGVTERDLQKGPGHYPGTPLPGQPGNVVISGHRTTYLHPFRNVDQLVAGDPIYLTTLSGTRYTYLVRNEKTVLPTDIGVIANTPDNRLTLTTCTPPYSASHRLIVIAMLQPVTSTATPA
jgi:sortase A